jgi:hypothetical protein
MHFSKFDEILKESFQRRLIVYNVEAVGSWNRVYPYDQKQAGADPVNHDIIVVLNREQYKLQILQILNVFFSHISVSICVSVYELFEVD